MTLCVGWQAILAPMAGILIRVKPKRLNDVVARYLTATGLLGLAR